ncbi:class II aldolase/adducin family protein [Kaistia geumhonensis]|uniref:L-fuculose-phosphate aldolase n=1 Tax=Kaistia geumhonensis TaxID=410839 RepID=A0ABU0M5G2_9HYPH|nr:class II aldolase/adducin family protein [Kaistia geumhonensis]MCX5478579.1 class II aldolase/adducin family protein [Kaistia geumhonensis]MDQ0516203.1 L-fuculose-phosphate aldolase [Kaistia geumhonensis]
MTELDLRREIIAHCLRMNAAGINQGVSGNISVRFGERMLITPTSIPYDRLLPEDIASMSLAGNDGAFEGPKPPSSEWRFHLDIMRSRPEVGAIVHTHPTYCTSLAIARRSIPACHYMIAIFGGDDVRCADYATYGTEQLSANVLKALEDRSACLLANHGAIATGYDLANAFWRAVELETIARQYFNALLIGGPVLLTAEEMKDTFAKGLGSNYAGQRAR